MTRVLTYNASGVLEGAVNGPPLLIMLPSGGKQVVASLVSRGEWRSTWTNDGEPLTDEEWDIVDSVVAAIYRSLEDGENVDELSSAVRYLADNLQVTHDGNCGCGCSGAGNFYELPNEITVQLEPGQFDDFITALEGITLGAFIDSGTNYPAPYTDRVSYDAAKCQVANQLYKDFRATLIQLRILDIAAVAISATVLGQALMGTGGAVTGLIGLGLSTGLAAAVVVVWALLFVTMAINFGIRLHAVGEYLDQETFVCGMFQAASVDEAREALVSSVRDAKEEAVAAGAFTALDIFDGALFQFIAVLVTDETLEFLFQLAAVAVDHYVDEGNDFDCSTCTGGTGGELLSVVDFAPYDGLFLPNMTPDGSIGSWKRIDGNGGGFTGHLQVTTDYVESAGDGAGSSAKAAHDFTVPSLGDLTIAYDRYGASANVNVTYTFDSWNGSTWVNIDTIGQKAGTGWDTVSTNYPGISAGTYRVTFRMHAGASRMRDPSVIHTPS